METSKIQGSRSGNLEKPQFQTWKPRNSKVPGLETFKIPRMQTWNPLENPKFGPGNLQDHKSRPEVSRKSKVQDLETSNFQGSRLGNLQTSSSSLAQSVVVFTTCTVCVSLDCLGFFRSETWVHGWGVAYIYICISYSNLHIYVYTQRCIYIYIASGCSVRHALVI